LHEVLTKLEAKPVVKPNENLGAKYDAENDGKFGVKKMQNLVQKMTL